MLKAGFFYTAWIWAVARTLTVFRAQRGIPTSGTELHYKDDGPALSAARSHFFGSFLPRWPAGGARESTTTFCHYLLARQGRQPSDQRGARMGGEENAAHRGAGISPTLHTKISQRARLFDKKPIFRFWLILLTTLREEIISRRGATAPNQRNDEGVSRLLAVLPFHRTCVWRVGI